MVQTSVVVMAATLLELTRVGGWFSRALLFVVGPIAAAFVHLMQMVSLNLAIFNLLPIPILDGGVILLLLVEMLLGRDLSMPVKEAVIKVGFVFLLVVTVFAVYNDISKILPPG